MASETNKTEFSSTLTLLSYQLQNCSISTPIKFSPLDPSNFLNNNKAVKIGRYTYTRWRLRTY